MKGIVIGATIGIGFGGVWAVAGATGFPRRLRAPVAILAISITTALVLACIGTRSSAAPGTFRGDVYGAAVALETAAIIAAAIALNRHARQDLLLPVIGFLVGLHFLGLWQATTLRRFIAVAAATSAVCALSLFLPGHGARGFDARRIVAGFGTALVLWISGALTLFDI